MFLHWGSKDESGDGALGSEHAINGHFFPAEIQLYGFNADLFHNLSQGMLQPNGAVGVVIMIQESDRGSNRGMKTILSHLKKVCFHVIFEIILNKSRHILSSPCCFLLYNVLLMP